MNRALILFFTAFLPLAATAVTFEEVVGEWTNGCVNLDKVYLQQHVSIGLLKGTATGKYFVNETCTGEPVRIDGPVKFTYNVKPGSTRAKAKFNLVMEDNFESSLQMTYQNEILTIFDGQNPTRFTRMKDPSPL